MSLTASRGKLLTALKELRAQWEETRRRWHDPVAKRFEEQVWGQLEATTLGAIAAMDRLDQVLLRARSECG